MKKQIYPPVVSVLGHVDHGKTTLLDAIRKTNIADREHGGITQKIGASEIEIIHEGEKRKITFIDTPGHETFSKMRSRGAKVADIGLLIVSAAEGVKPQTIESLKAFREANVPFIVVFTKIDLETADIERVKQQLLKEEVLIEGYGGDIPTIQVSAKANKNIKELLDLILLVFDLSENKEDLYAQNFEAVIIESKLDKRQGPIATIVVKKGKINLKEKLLAEDIQATIKALANDRGENVKEVSVGEAAEILGFEKVPPVGAKVFKKDETKEVEVKKDERQMQKPGEYRFDEEKPALSIILRADTEGSLEAIINALPSEINIVSKKTGEVNEAGVILAKSIGGIIISFNVKIRNEVLLIAKQEKVLAKNYTIIYELISEIKDVLEGKKLAAEERIYGVAKVLASFPFEKTKVLGISVLDGRVAKGDRIRLVRGEDIMGESSITSLRQGKNQTSKIEKGEEGGAIISPFLDFTIGDMLISHE